MFGDSAAPASPISADLARAARLIREGKLVAFPTETVYGLGANALNPAAVRRIFQVKGRPRTSPLIVHVKSIEMARQLVRHWPAEAQQLAEKFWPGPLTLVVHKHPGVPDEVTAGLDTVAIRIPGHPIALALIREAGVPLAAPSANKFTRLSPTTAEHVRASFTEEEVPMVLDGGPSEVGIESTVVSLTGRVPVLLRPGMIAFDNIVRATDPGAGAHPSPGMHERHYSPRTRIVLVQNGDALPGGRGAYLWWKSGAEAAARAVRMPETPQAYAAALYGILHELDAESLDWIAIEQVPDSTEWLGIHDRLDRAAG
jgi:L-threonylcarbamoyladenylate synthase